MKNDSLVPTNSYFDGYFLTKTICPFRFCICLLQLVLVTLRTAILLHIAVNRNVTLCDIAVKLLDPVQDLLNFRTKLNSAKSLPPSDTRCPKSECRTHKLVPLLLRQFIHFNFGLFFCFFIWENRKQNKLQIIILECEANFKQVKLLVVAACRWNFDVFMCKLRTQRTYVYRSIQKRKINSNWMCERRIETAAAVTGQRANDVCRRTYFYILLTVFVRCRARMENFAAKIVWIKWKKIKLWANALYAHFKSIK